VAAAFMHDLGLIVTLAIAFSAALLFGYITQRLGLSPILGYLLAGIAVGSHTPGLVANVTIASQLAEVGVILLMFGVGLHFRLKDLLNVRSIAIPGAVGQSLAATAMGTVVALVYGWGIASGVVLGIAISVASTVVLMRGLMDRGVLDSPPGHAAVGWLIVEDIFTVLVLVLLPVIVSSGRGATSPSAVLVSVGVAVLKLAVLAVLVLWGGAKAVPWILTKVARTRSRELFTLAVLAIALAVATGSALVFGASVALGAFLAGMVVGQSPLSHQAAADALPMRDAFAVVFFVSVGMLFDPRFVLAQPGLVAAVLAIILLVKPLVALVIVIALGYSVRTALVVAMGLAQIGEFSFILADVGRKLGVLPAAGHSVLVAGALISIGLNPLLFRSQGAIENWLRRHPRLWALLSRRAEARGRDANLHTAAQLEKPDERPRAVVVGYGRVGQTVTSILEGFGMHPIVIELDVETVSSLVKGGRSAIFGDAGSSEILKAAGVEKAKYLVVTTPDLVGRIPIIVAARELNEALYILVRARYLAERATLEEFGVTAACYEEEETAVGLAELLLRDAGTPEERIRGDVERIRAALSSKEGPPFALS
jgi:CPA2 family monovalent cation:H+ antiporter-2